MKKLWFTLSIISFVIGFCCLFFSFFLKPDATIFTISTAIGVALLPTGVISIITSLSSSHVIEENVRIKLDETTAKLHSSIESLKATSQAIEDNVGKKLDATTKNLHYSINDLKVTTEFLNRSKELGVKMVYENRGSALERFLDHLEDYVQGGSEGKNKEIVFVGSSFKGLIEDDPKYAEQLKRILTYAKGKCDCKFLLTHPSYSGFREAQEDRPEGGIAKEILHAIAWLEDRGLSRNNIKVYKGTPTCFMIASKERMLINPYPYQREAYRSFCLELENTGSERSIFYSFWTNHYFKPWFGDDKRKDHFMIPNTLVYSHERFDGPFPEKNLISGEEVELFADFFVIKDTGSFYIAVNIRGLEPEISYNRKSDGSCDVIKIGDELTVKLLDLSEEKNIWKTLGSFELSEIRNGFWHRTFKESKAFTTFAMLGIFDEKNPNPFKFERANSLIDGQPLPILWKWLLKGNVIHEGDQKETRP